jgi:nucleoid-associated protein YgaU
MSLFGFIADAGEKLFGSAQIDEKKVREHILAQGLKFSILSVVAHANKKVSLIGYADTLEDKEKAIIAAGNIKGIEEVEDRIKVGPRPTAATATPAPTLENAPLPDAAENPSSGFYTVQKGDTLSKIAKEQYGNANKYPQIFEANRPMLSHPDKIYPGQVLRIPKQ